MNHIVHTSFSHLSIDFNLKIIIKSKFRTLSKSWVTKPLIVWVFKHSELKITNVRMLKFHIRLCPSYVCDSI